MAALTSESHRRAQLIVNARALRDFLSVFSILDFRGTSALDRTWPVFERATRLLIREYGRTSAGLAYRYYRDARTDAGIRGSAPTMKSTPTDAEIDAGLLAMGLYNASHQLGLGRTMKDVRDATLVNLSGVVTKYTLDHGRDVIRNAVMDDPAAKGWQRQTSGAPCSFCSMIASRGIVYRSAGSADFEAHRHCGCSASPVF